MNFILIIVNVVLAMVAVVLMTIGGLHSYDTKIISDLEEDELQVENLIIATGCILMIISWIGITVSILVTKKWLFIVYGILLLLCHFLQLIMSVLCFLEMIKMKYFINGSLREKFVIYYNETVTNKTVQDEVDRIQKEWNCCGYRNVTKLTQQLPESCCENKEANCTKNEARTDECKRAAGGVLRSPLKAAGSLGIIFGLFEFFIALWSFYAAKQKQS